jgi:hypothetical protein
LRRPRSFHREFTFVPSGISGYRYPRLFGDSSGRMAVISPFITPDCLTKDLPAGRESILITRGESLDALSENAAPRAVPEISAFTPCMRQHMGQTQKQAMSSRIYWGQMIPGGSMPSSILLKRGHMCIAGYRVSQCHQGRLQGA